MSSMKPTFPPSVWLVPAGRPVARRPADHGLLVRPQIERVLREPDDLLPRLAALDLLRRARVRRLAVGLLAAAKREVVILKSLVVRVDLGPALIAHALVPGPPGRDVVVLAVV